jgi:hypothetical protein
MTVPSWLLHGHGEEGLRAVAGALVERVCARKVKARLGIHVCDVDRALVDGGVGGHQRIVGRTVGAAQRQVGQRNALAGGAALAYAQRVGAHDLEAQRPTVGRHVVERARIGAGQGLGGFEDVFEQAFDVALARERGADLVELLQAAEQLDGG